MNGVLQNSGHNLRNPLLFDFRVLLNAAAQKILNLIFFRRILCRNKLFQSERFQIFHERFRDLPGCINRKMVVIDGGFADCPVIGHNFADFSGSRCGRGVLRLIDSIDVSGTADQKIGDIASLHFLNVGFLQKNSRKKRTVAVECLIGLNGILLCFMERENLYSARIFDFFFFLFHKVLCSFCKSPQPLRCRVYTVVYQMTSGSGSKNTVQKSGKL